MYLSEYLREYNTLIGLTLINISTLAAYDNNIDIMATEALHKKAEVLWKVKLNESKVEAATKRGAKKMLLSVFTDIYTNK